MGEKDKHGHRKKGVVKKGAGNWNQSGRQRRIEALKSEMERKLAAYRKSLHGRLINELLAMGDEIKIEKFSYRALQKKHAKSVGNHAPGMFVEMSRRKAANAGGAVY